MASGDPQRIWFPEMVDMLRQEWKPPISCVALIELCDRQDMMLQAIRSDKKILSPIMKCSKCGWEGRMAPPKVSVRALILALARFGIAQPEEAKKLEKEWSLYREQNQLDLYGKRQQSTTGNCAMLHDSAI
ncbi:MAG TPA: hypothetical protein VE778_05175 [Candidatus Bathyarchaeia archaeon]|jgi:hypothetical protein|nr:hypothetical protein [Candidatus Bathyarchaeia archaeon]